MAKEAFTVNYAVLELISHLEDPYISRTFNLRWLRSKMSIMVGSKITDLSNKSSLRNCNIFSSIYSY